MTKNKIYFASDFHLGAPNLNESHARERIIFKWLEEIQVDAKSIYFLGETVGNLDVGGILGSYLGLFMLVSAFIAIGFFLKKKRSKYPSEKCCS